MTFYKEKFNKEASMNLLETLLNNNYTNVRGGGTRLNYFPSTNSYILNISREPAIYVGFAA